MEWCAALCDARGNQQRAGTAGLRAVRRRRRGRPRCRCALLAWGLLRHRRGRAGGSWQVPGVLLFGAATLWALSLDDPDARSVLATGWLGHAAWYVVHFRANGVVPRWWSEWCVVPGRHTGRRAVTLPVTCCQVSGTGHLTLGQRVSPERVGTGIGTQSALGDTSTTREPPHTKLPAVRGGMRRPAPLPCSGGLAQVASVG